MYNIMFYRSLFRKSVTDLTMALRDWDMVSKVSQYLEYMVERSGW
jgi:hypothetical protein